MRYRKQIVLCLLCVFLLGSIAQAEGEWTSPTRHPDAPEYRTDHPERLVPEQIVARCFLVMNRATGDVYLAQNEDMRMYPAATATIMTALLALEHGALDDQVFVAATAVNTLAADASRVPFKEGEEVTLRDALVGMLHASGCDAANALAEHVSGSQADFVALMNKRAQELGCTNTHFTNAHGYHDPDQYTTASDLARMMNAAMENQDFRALIGMARPVLHATNLHPERRISAGMLHILPDSEYYYPHSQGGRSGYTDKAGFVMLEAAQKDGMELVAVALYTGKYSRWPDTSRLFEYAFSTEAVQ